MDYLERYNIIADEFDRIDLDTFAGVQLSKLLAFPISWIAFDKQFSIIDSLKRIIGQLIFDYSFRVENNGGTNLFIITHRYIDRPDHIETIERIAGTIDKHDIIYPIQRRYLSIKGLKYFANIFVWYSKLKKCRFIKKTSAIGIISYLLTAIRYKDCFNSIINIEQYKTVTVRMDGQLLDNILIQTIRSGDIATITVQDGFEVKPPVQINKTWQLQAKLRGSVSKYFIVWSEYFRDIVEQVVSPTQKVVSLGIPKYINQIPHIIQNENCIGILLDASSTENSNVEMISIIKAICVKHNLKYKLRYHPSDKIHIYDEHTDDRVLTSDDKVNFQKFVAESRYIIGCNSTSILEAALINSHTYRMKPINCIDVLTDCNFPNNFRDIEELDWLITKDVVLDPDYVDKVCGPKDITQRYHDFYFRLN